ncbi:MAG: hypothetical protein AB9866_10665 [Syntrophobacteraceae bacterium]
MCEREIEAGGIGLRVLEALDDDSILLSRIACPVCGQPLLQYEYSDISSHGRSGAGLEGFSMEGVPGFAQVPRSGQQSPTDFSHPSVRR